MKLVEFTRGFVGMPAGDPGAPVFINPAWVAGVVPHASERGVAFITLAGAPCELVLGAPSAVADRLAGAGVDRLPDIYAFAQPERAPFMMKGHRAEPVKEEPALLAVPAEETCVRFDPGPCPGPLKGLDPPPRRTKRRSLEGTDWAGR